VDELKKLWANKRLLSLQGLNLAMVVLSALMIWRGLMVVTNSESPVVVVLRCAPLSPRASGCFASPLPHGVASRARRHCQGRGHDCACVGDTCRLRSVADNENIKTIAEGLQYPRFLLCTSCTVGTLWGHCANVSTTQPRVSFSSISGG
jgi:hypothetical protein